MESTPSPNSSVEKAVKSDKLIKDGKPRVLTTTRKNCKDKPTRVRTVLNEKQLSTLKRCYAANPRPDSVMKEQLVDMTGLSPRVIRVWFQNKRCKDKKRMMMNGGDGKMGVCIYVKFLWIKSEIYYDMLNISILIFFSNCSNKDLGTCLNLETYLKAVFQSVEFSEWAEILFFARENVALRLN